MRAYDLDTDEFLYPPDRLRAKHVWPPPNTQHHEVLCDVIRNHGGTPVQRESGP